MLQLCSSAADAQRKIAVAKRAQCVDAGLIQRDVFADDALRAVRRLDATTGASTTTARLCRLNCRRDLASVKRAQRARIAF